MSKYNHFIAILLLCLPLAAQAAEFPQLAFPLDCELGKDCWTINYLDVDVSGKDSDFTCGTKTTLDHKGTDFGLRNRRAMEEGVNVLAVLDGRVMRIRNSEDDNKKTAEDLKNIQANNRDCGNGILIAHENGLETFYCHLKKDSLRVKPEEEVKAGQVIAQVGQSGYAETPRLHLSVISKGHHLDPFTGVIREDGCGKFRDNLWKDDLQYEPFTVIDAGWSKGVPDFKAIEDGTDQEINASGDGALVFWVSFFHARPGDKILMTLQDPEGRIFSEREINITEARQDLSYYYTGKRLGMNRTLPPGTYTGSAHFTRAGAEDYILRRTIAIR